MKYGCDVETEWPMFYDKTKWDYFCELWVVVPGLSAMFDDDGYIAAKALSKDGAGFGREDCEQRGDALPPRNKVDDRDRRESVKMLHTQIAGPGSGSRQDDNQ